MTLSRRADYSAIHSADHSRGHSAARSASPSASFYAMTDDEEGGYNTVTHTETGRGVKLLFSKSKVRPA